MKIAKITFRTGQTMTLQGNSIQARKGDNSPFYYLYVDGEKVIRLNRGLPNFDENNNFKLYNAFPTPKLYELMPDDWDKTNSSLQIIDEIFVRVLPQDPA